MDVTSQKKDRNPVKVRNAEQVLIESPGCNLYIRPDDGIVEVVITKGSAKISQSVRIR